jgi:hypothetical protein
LVNVTLTLIKNTAPRRLVDDLLPFVSGWLPARQELLEHGLVDRERICV